MFPLKSPALVFLPLFLGFVFQVPTAHGAPAKLFEKDAELAEIVESASRDYSRILREKFILRVPAESILRQGLLPVRKMIVASSNDQINQEMQMVERFSEVISKLEVFKEIDKAAIRDSLILKAFLAKTFLANCTGKDGEFDLTRANEANEKAVTYLRKTERVEDFSELLDRRDLKDSFSFHVLALLHFNALVFGDIEDATNLSKVLLHFLEGEMDSIKRTNGTLQKTFLTLSETEPEEAMFLERFLLLSTLGKTRVLKPTQDGYFGFGARADAQTTDQ